jgi:predicted transcriptional regulator
MCKILLSINSEHVANILNGSKKVEYRKVTCRCDVDMNNLGSDPKLFG